MTIFFTFPLQVKPEHNLFESYKISTFVEELTIPSRLHTNTLMMFTCGPTFLFQCAPSWPGQWEVEYTLCPIRDVTKWISNPEHSRCINHFYPKKIFLPQVYFATLKWNFQKITYKIVVNVVLEYSAYLFCKFCGLCY